MIQAELIATANALADAAGDVLRRYFRAPLTVASKADASPVTVADREAEAVMRKILAERCPADGIFGEEGERVNAGAVRQWVLDPIDGTRPFIAGYPTFTTLIAFCENGVPVLGVIDQPILRERWVGVRGQATLLNGKPVKVSECADFRAMRMATTSPDYFTEVERKAFARVRSSDVLYGGDAYAYAMLASGHLEAVIDAGLKPYDFCALTPVIEGAGGIITDWKGAALTIDSNGRVLASCNKQIHQMGLDKLNG